MMETVSAQPLPANTQGGTVSQDLEPGLELRAKVDANLPGGVVRLVSENRSIELRVPTPLPVGSDVTVSVSGTKQQPAVVLTPAQNTGSTPPPNQSPQQPTNATPPPSGGATQPAPPPAQVLGQTPSQTAPQNPAQPQQPVTGQPPPTGASGGGQTSLARPAAIVAQVLQATGILPLPGQGGAAALPAAPTGLPGQGAVPGGTNPGTALPPGGATGGLQPQAPAGPGAVSGNPGGVPTGTQPQSSLGTPAPASGQPATGPAGTPSSLPAGAPASPASGAVSQVPLPAGQPPVAGGTPVSGVPQASPQGAQPNVAQGAGSTPLQPQQPVPGQPAPAGQGGNAPLPPAGGQAASGPGPTTQSAVPQGTPPQPAALQGQAATTSSLQSGFSGPTGPAGSSGQTPASAYTAARAPLPAGGASPAVGTSAGAPATPLQQAANSLSQPLAEQQASIGGLFAQIGTLMSAQSAGKASVPDAVQKAMQQILGLRLNLNQPVTANALQQAVRGSGQFKEGQLPLPTGAQQAALPDLKSALLSFKSLLQQLGAQPAVRFPARQPAPPSRQSGPQGQAPQTSSGYWAGSAPQNLQSLLQDTDAALARMRLTQLVNAGLAGDDGPQATAAKPMDAVVELPVTVGNETAVMQMQVGRDGGGKAEDDEEEPAWRLRFALNLTATGPLEAAVSLRGGGTYVSLWVDRKETLDLLAGLQETMEAAFADAGLDLQELRFIRGLPLKTAAKYGALINRQS